MVLAESMEEDPKNLSITYRLRKGVKFHDGTPFNAEAVKWNFEIRLEKNALTDGKYVKSIQVVDDYTLKVNVTEFHNQLAFNYGWQQMYSPTAFKQAGGGDVQKSIAWARTHAVGTGPFKVVEFKGDTLIRWERNNDYWQPGKPYLDGMEVRYIPDIMTASAIMQVGEADVWMDVSAVQNILDLQKKGFKVNWGPGMFWAILPNSSDANSPFANKKVREAVEYAIDRPGVAKMLGYGQFEPLTQMAPSGWPGYVPGYNPRPYNPAKAKQLLAEAGYPNGFQTELLASVTSQDGAAALQAYLAAVGINVKLDMTDPGRYATAAFQTGWKGMIFAASGINPDSTDLYVHFGPSPMTYRTGTIAKSDAFLAACNTALRTYVKADETKAIQAIVRQGAEDAMIIPIYRSAQALVMQPYVHSDYIKIHSVVWDAENDWMEKH
jgi:peptide/nickel transport system substrate-binding protein